MTKRLFVASVLVLAVAACDDGGVTSPDTTTSLRPRLVFSTDVGGTYAPYDGKPDTVGMFRPFAISYHGIASGFQDIAGYWFELGRVPPVNSPWTDDVADTLREFPNSGADAFPGGFYHFLAKCRDERSESETVRCDIVVNFDPDTRFTRATSHTESGGQMHERDIDFGDAVADTVPYGSWLRLEYNGWDDPRDGAMCDPGDPDACIAFQVNYERVSAGFPGSFATSGWLPRGATFNTDSASAMDSNTVNVGSVEYDFMARAIDENGKADGTPPRLHIVGNYDPTLDGVSLADHFGNEVNLAVLDTLTWNFWRGEGWPYTTLEDTVDTSAPGEPYVKTFSFHLRASGHDDPRDPAGSAVRAWRYVIFDEDGNYWPLARAGAAWRDASMPDALDDVFERTFTYGSSLTGEGAGGDDVFDSLPGYLDRDLTVVLGGRDTAEEDRFEQYIFLDGERTLINAYAIGNLGRRTRERTFTFHFRIVR